MNVLEKEKLMIGTKLNYVMPVSLDLTLEKYCQETGRTASDVIRQLLAEYLDGDRELNKRHIDLSESIRSNMLVPEKMKKLLDLRSSLTGVSLGTIVVKLLSDFLEGKGKKEIINVDLKLDQTIIEYLHCVALEKNQTLEQTIENIIKTKFEKELS